MEVGSVQGQWPGREVPAISGTSSWGSLVLAVLGNHLKAPQVGTNGQTFALMVLDVETRAGVPEACPLSV